MTKAYSRFLAACFCLFLGGLLVWHVLMPDRARSETENRTLAQRPELTWSALADGSFTKAAEDYFADQFPLRDGWTGVKARAELLLGKREFNNVYLCGDTLIAKVNPPLDGLEDRNLDCVRRMAERTEIPVYLALVPSAAEVWREKLPAGAESWDQAAFISRAAELEGVEPVDVLGALRARAEEDIFYRTDHHWTTLGAYYGYAVLMEALGRGEEVLEPEAAKERDLLVSNGFQGTLYSQSGIHWLEPDSIEFWVEDRGLSVISWRDGAPEETGLYDSDYLGEKDKYSAFLGGSQPLCVIRNEAGTGRLMLVRDSYADSLAPFLARHFEEVHLLDLRYYRGSPAAYAQEHGVDGIVVLQSVPNLITDRNLALLSQ